MKFIRADNLMDLQVGTVLQKGRKKYLLIGWDIIEAGHAKEFRLLRLYANWKPRFQFIKDVYDRDICNYFICKLIV